MSETKTPSSSFIEELTKAIEKDDIKTFTGCMEKFPCGSFRLGRFPVLSALYLCRSGKILKAYEKQFMSIGSWQPLTEPVKLATLFRKTAGKCMRLYLEEVVTPPEMLALTEQTKKLKKQFGKFRLSAAAKQRVKDVYMIKYGLEVKYEDNNAYFPSRPMNRREKNIIILACVGAFILAASAVSVPFIVNEFKPFIKDKNGALIVSSFKQIDFDSENSYVLKKDITLDKSFYTKNLKCTIDGNGKTITFNGKKSAVGLLAGTIKNAVIKTAANVPFIDSVDIPGNIQSVTVKADSEVEVSKNFGYLVNNNYGTIDGVTLHAGGSLSVTRDTEDTASAGVSVGGIVAANCSYWNYYGIIQNCKAVYTDFCLTGVSNADTSFGGIAGQNAGTISYSVTEGSINSDTVDAAGICGLNQYCLKGCDNKASITQVSQSLNWNPVCAGIAVANEGPIDYCRNYGKISSSSLLDGEDSDAYPHSVSAGIAGSATAYIYGCANYGEITAEATGNAFASGICGHSYAETGNCLSEGNIFVSGKEVYAGGIAAASNAQVVNRSIRFGFAKYCISDCSISATADKAYIGGIAGFIGSGGINHTDVFGEIIQTVYYGGAIYCLSISDISITGDGYSGGITGVCSAILTDGADGSGNINTFEFNSITYESLRENVFLKSDGAQNAAGATVSADGEAVTYGNGSDAGATFDTKDKIKASELYSRIIGNLTEKDD